MTKQAWKKGGGAGLACLLLAVSLFVSGQAAEATHSTFAAGDVFVSMQDGTVQWFHPDGTFNAVLPTWFPGSKAEGMGFDASGNLYVNHWSPGNTVEKFNTTGSPQGTFGSGYNCNPNSIVFDAAGYAYVGQKDCEGDILKFNAAGALQAAFNAAPELRGTGWIDLAADGCTIFYTSEGVKVKRYNVCAQAQLPDFNAMPLPGSPSPLGMGAQAVGILPDGQVLVADDSVIVRLDASGNQVVTYDVVGETDGWLGLDLVGDGTFWASNFGSGNVVRFNIATGAVLTVFNAGPSSTVKGVAVARAPSAVSHRGRMTGGGSIFTGPADYGVPIGTRITHGYELHCNWHRKPNNLEVNIHGVVAGRYHLEDLYYATCYDDPSISPNPPAAPFDTYEGEGTGRYNGEPGCTMRWIFTDAGEPGTSDRIRQMHLRCPSGVAWGINEPGYTLTFGNHQAHK